MGCGIIGGTFNPVHFGHLRAAEEVAESMALARVIFVPAAKPPHKESVEIAPFQHRWHMLKLGVAENPRFELSDLEHQRPGKSYSVETLAELTRHHGKDENLHFLLGLDAFLELPTWKDYRELFSLCHFVVVARSGYSAKSLSSMLRTQVSEDYCFDSLVRGFVHPHFHNVYYREVTLLDISSSKIRELLGEGRSVRYLVPEKVWGYIMEQGLYQSR